MGSPHEFQPGPVFRPYLVTEGETFERGLPCLEVATSALVLIGKEVGYFPIVTPERFVDRLLQQWQIRGTVLGGVRILAKYQVLNPGNRFCRVDRVSHELLVHGKHPAVATAGVDAFVIVARDRAVRPVGFEAVINATRARLKSSWLPGSGWRVWLLRLFGAVVGTGVIIKPHVRVKFPWKLRIGDHSWIGESVWIDNLAEVSIGSNCCISQGAYLCTGSHRWDKESFDLEAKPITIEDECWVGAMARVAPGVVMGQGAVLTMCSVVVSNLDEWQVFSGSPALASKKRTVG